LLATLVRHYDDLVDHVRRRFGERVFAREVVHDLCVQLLEDDEKEGVRKPLALLRKIAHDNAISHCRRERRRSSLIVAVAELPDVACSAAPCRRGEDTGQADCGYFPIAAALPGRVHHAQAA
jgi:RNA polymerase sigma-70 factor (ECF subfamily)